MLFIIERYSYYGTAYTLRIPLIPGLPWPYFRHDVGTRSNDDTSPNDDDAKSVARSVLATRWFRYGKKVANTADFEFRDTFGS